jgi:curved DNA-binding protein CbpA
MPEIDYFEFLGLKRDATEVQIEAALRKKKIELTQLRNSQSNNEACQLQQKQLNEASKQLTPQNRPAYLRQLDAGALQATQQVIMVKVDDNQYQCIFSPSNISTLRPTPFHTSNNPQHWNIQPQPASNQLKVKIVQDLSTISKAIYLAISLKLAYRLEITDSKTGFSSFSFSHEGKPLTETQQATVQQEWTYNFNRLAPINPNPDAQLPLGSMQLQLGTTQLQLGSMQFQVGTNQLQLGTTSLQIGSTLEQSDPQEEVSSVAPSPFSLTPKPPNSTSDK